MGSNRPLNRTRNSEAPFIRTSFESMFSTKNSSLPDILEIISSFAASNVFSSDGCYFTDVEDLVI